jgi:predicted Rossmann fold nucleotide-binding protein DprA/Smf involved in DNA uptake
MSAEIKITDRERYTKIAETIPEYAEWANKKIKAMDNRNEKRKNTPKKEKPEAIAFKASVLALITDTPQTSKAIADALGVNFQKVTPALTALVKENKVVQVKEKSTKAYILATEVELESEGE